MFILYYFTVIFKMNITIEASKFMSENLFDVRKGPK